MSNIHLELIKLEDQGAGPIASIGILKQSTPTWAPKRSVLGSDCMSSIELKELVAQIRKDLNRLEKEGELFFEREKKRRIEGTIKWPKPESRNS